MVTVTTSRTIRFLVAIGAAALLATSAVLAPGVASAQSGSESSGRGVLEVASSPDVATQIRVGDVVRNTSRVFGLPLATGDHLVCFTAPEGYLAPPCQTVMVEAGETAQMTGAFVTAGKLVVETEPASLRAEISVDEVLRDRGAIEIPIEVGVHEVCFEELAGYVAPSCQVVEVGADGPVRVHATYEPVPTPSEPEPGSGATPEPEPEPAPEPVVETSARYSGTLGGRTMTREHAFTAADGDVAVRIDFSRAETVDLALLDAAGRRIDTMSAVSGSAFVSTVPAGDYRVTVTGSRAHYDLTVTHNQPR
jgi:hypothetical protein